MARREYARIGVDMPEEESIRALDVGAQWLYDRLLLRKEISRCGVVQWRPALLAELAADATDRKIRTWVRQLTDRNHVILDEPYAEALVRTYVRWDGLLGQPNVVPHLVYDFGLIASKKVRIAFLVEFRRLWDLPDLPEGERGGWLLAAGHFPRRKHARDDPAKWPVALEPETLARLVSAIGKGLREPLTAAIAAGEVAPFDPASPHGMPDPFLPTLGGMGSPHPSGDGFSCAHVSAGAPTGSVTGTDTGSESESGNRVRVTGPQPAAAAAAKAHTPAEIAPTDPDQLVQQHGGRLTGAVRLALVGQARQLLDEQIDPVTVAAGLALWRERPGSGPGLLSYLVNDLMLDAQLPKKPGVRVNGSAPPWCGECDETSRWEDAGDGWRRCPRCHPVNAAAAEAVGA